MSHEDSDHSAAESLTAEFRDGKLQIVEVTPFDKSSDDDTETIQVEADGDTGKFMQVIHGGGKGVLQLDLLNLTFVRCEGDDGDQYRLVTNSESSEGGGEYLNEDATVTCVLQSSDGEEQEDQNQESYVMVEDQNQKSYVMVEDQNQKSYVMVEGEHEQSDGSSYVMVEGEGGQGVVLLQSETSAGAAKKEETPQKPQTTYDILERAKALRKAKRLLEESLRPRRGRGRRLTRDVTPAAQELLASPRFKLFLYSCKLCRFQCNAIRDLTQHRSTVHGTGAKRRPSDRATQLQCPCCPYRAITSAQMLQHTQSHRVKPEPVEKFSEVAISCAAPDSVLVCGACGFESSSRREFRRHIAQSHQTMLADRWVEDDENEK